MCFMDDFAHRNLILEIFCYRNCVYSLYNNVNTENNSSVPKLELYDIIIRHFLHYLKTNKWHRY